MRFSTAVSSLLFGLAPLVAHAAPAATAEGKVEETLDLAPVTRGNLTERSVGWFYIYYEATTRKEEEHTATLEQGLKILSIPDPLCGFIKTADLWKLRTDLSHGRQGGLVRFNHKSTTNVPEDFVYKDGTLPSALEFNANDRHFTIYDDQGPWSMIDVDNVIRGRCQPHQTEFDCDMKDGTHKVGRSLFACDSDDPRFLANAWNEDQYS
ncbi:hypothetical protein PGQ11_013563 [Apiospora arundinis]|uniref:AA1-like domain-containing protein n=1 Tax=Apiospora arundinis TaxID=335852 RepID=A0ABR2HPW3_9PEZI